MIDIGLLNFEPGHEGEPGVNKIFGGAGNDIIYGGSAQNTILGGLGNDFLVGAGGSADYFWFPGDGHDLINDYSPNKNTPGLEEHRLILWPFEPVDWYVSGLTLTADDIELETSGTDLIFNIIPTGESIRVMNWFLGRAFQLDLFAYGYGFWERETINSFLPILQGTEDLDGLDADESVKFVNGEGANDYITITGGGHIITGGPGSENIIFQTNASSDPNTLIWNLGDDDDFIVGDYDQVIVVFGEGISPGDITFEDGEYGWTVNAPGGSMLFIQNGYGTGELSQIRFADGTVWDSEDIESISGGGISPFSMSLEEIARTFWDSLPPEGSEPETAGGREPVSSSGGSGGGCDTGSAGAAAAAAIFVVRKMTGTKTKNRG